MFISKLGMETNTVPEHRRRRGAFLATLMVLTILPSSLQALDIHRTAVGENVEEIPRDIGDFLGLRQAVNQLTQRFATLEVSLESRLGRLTDSATKEDVLLETLSSRLIKVDALVEKVDALDLRLTQETSSLRSTLRDTNRDLQTVAGHLERLDNRVKGEENSRHDVRSNWSGRPTTDMDLITTLITRRLGDYMERTIPRMVNEALATFQATLIKHMSKNVDEIAEEWRQGREELEDLGTQTLRKVSETKEDLQIVAKKIYDSFQEVNDKIQSTHDDIAYKIRMSPLPSMGELRPVLQQVNQSVVQSVERAAAGLNVTLREEAARRRGTEESGRADSLPLHCPDPTTVAALQEVKQLLQSVLKKSEDLRRGLTKQTSEGVDLLKLLHQRFSVLLRRMNTEPDHGQQLVAEMQDLGSLVESSYTAVLVAQNAFIESCKRIQAEEPTLELKIAEILDKLVTDINLGHKFSRMQLNELKLLVERLSTARSSSGSLSQEEDGEEDLQRDLRANQEFSLSSETSSKLNEVRETILETIESANQTVSRLEAVQQRVDAVSSELVETDWTNVRQKEPADQLVTAAKDLRGFARDQIIQSLNLYQTLLATLEQITVIDPGILDNASVNQSTTDQSELGFTFPPYLNEEQYTASQVQLTLPGTCTAAILEQVRNLPEFRISITNTPTSKDPLGDEEETQEDEEDVPAWYTDPDFLSGNYGTPDKGLPVFREEEWREIGDYANDDYFYIEIPSTTDSSAITASPLADTNTTTSTTTTTTTTSITTSPSRISPGGVDRYFGSKTNNHQPSTSKMSKNQIVEN